MGVLQEEPRQPVMWCEADSGAPSFEGEFEVNLKTLTVLMDAATDRIK
jgi:hypothetical protein